MSDNDKAELYRLVRSALDGGARNRRRQRVYDSIFAAHNGRPDGQLVTTENMHLFRQYRNSVSGSPNHLIEAALRFHAQEAAT